MKTYALVTNIIMLIILVPSVLGLITSPFLFDSGATKRTWMIFVSIISLPVLIIGSQIFSWIAYNHQNYESALKIGLIPTIDILFIIILFSISSDLK